MGLALAAFLPRYALFSAAPQATPPPVERPAAPTQPLVRAAPVPASYTAPLPPPRSAPSTAEPAPASILQVAARRSRGQRPVQPKAESGAFGKAAAPAEKPSAAPAEAPAEAKAATPEAEPPPDVWSDAEIIAALKDCLERLAPLGAEIEIAEPVKKERCGAPAPVVLERIGAGEARVEFQPAPMLNCAMVASLHAWVTKTLQPAARETLGSPVVRIRNASGYVCRNRVGSLFHSDRLSEHALANAIDISGFVTADGRTVDVLSTWGPTVRDLREEEERIEEEATAAKSAAKEAEREAAQAARSVAKAARGEKREQAKAEAARKKAEAERKRDDVDRLEAERREILLRIAQLGKLGRTLDAKAIPVSRRGRPPRRQRRDEEESGDARGLTPTALNPSALFLRRLHKGACGTFGTVLGPEANEAHRNHFHFDLAARKRRAFCQ